MVTFDTSRLRYIDKWSYSPNTTPSSNSIQFSSNEKRSALLTYMYKRFRNLDYVSQNRHADSVIKSNANRPMTSVDLNLQIMQFRVFLKIEHNYIDRITYIGHVPYINHKNVQN